MVSKHVTDSITDAKNALDNIEQLGETAYDICDGVLQNIKGFIHDETVWNKIQTHENKVHQEFKIRLKKANEELKNMEPLLAFRDGMKKYMKLRQWKSLEMLNFYDKLSKEHDI